MNGDKSIISCIQAYFTNNQVNQNIIDNLLSLGNQEGNKGRQQYFISKIFSIMQSRFTKENMKMFIKRFLHIVTELLNHDQQKQEKLKYQDAVSKKIVQYFITLLTLIFKNTMNDLILEMKVYRKKWAKRITDEAFYQLKEKAFQKFRFDVDKGFPEDTLKKIRRQYEKRKFNEEDLQKYLGIRSKQERQQRNYSQAERKPRKIVKRDQDSESQDAETSKNEVKETATYAPPINDMMGHHSSYIPSHSSHNYSQVPQPYYFQSYPPHQQYPFNNNMGNTNTNISNTNINNVNGRYYPVGSHHPQVVKPHPYPNYPPQKAYPPYIQQNYSTFNNTKNSDNNKYIINNPPKVIEENNRLKTQIFDILNSLKESSLYECRTCGLKLSSQQKHNLHTEKHFNDAQKGFETSHSRRDHLRKQKMPTIQEWIENGVNNNIEQLIVPVSNISKDYQFCFVCKDSLKVIWSDILDEWVFTQAVKIKIRESKKIKICHYQCYKIFEDSYDRI